MFPHSTFVSERTHTYGSDFFQWTPKAKYNAQGEQVIDSYMSSPEAIKIDAELQRRHSGRHGRRVYGFYFSDWGDATALTISSSCHMDNITCLNTHPQYMFKDCNKIVVGSSASYLDKLFSPEKGKKEKMLKQCRRHVHQISQNVIHEPFFDLQDRGFILEGSLLTNRSPSLWCGFIVRNNIVLSYVTNEVCTHELWFDCY